MPLRYPVRMASKMSVALFVSLGTTIDSTSLLILEIVLCVADFVTVLRPLYCILYISDINTRTYNYNLGLSL
jgi:hypothetical protein